MPPRPDLEAVLVEGLNPEQARAVTTTRPKILQIAGAGAGKTTVLARRVVNLIARGVPPELILCVTFTRKAAGEMEERIEGLLHTHLPSRKLPEVRTLHSWAVQMIRRYPEHFGLTRDLSIYDERDREDVLRMVARERGLKNWERGRVTTLWADLGVRRAYTERLLSGNAIDFDMIEDYGLRLLQEHGEVATRWKRHYRHVLVDEYQDTNLAQVAILQDVQPDNFGVVGDPRQSIYRFRGAEVQTILDHARDADFEVIELTTNYRSVPGIVTFANALVDGDWKPMESGRRHAPECRTVWARGPAAVECVHGYDACPICDPCTCRAATPVTGHIFRSEPPLVAHLVREERRAGRAWGDIAVLARNWAAVDAIYEHLRAGGVPVNYCGEEDDPWTLPEGRNLARALLLANNPADDNLAALLSEWGAIGRKRFDDILVLRARAGRGRSSLLAAMVGADPQWGSVCARLMNRVGAWKLADYARAFIDGLELQSAYGERGLVSRWKTLTQLLEDLPRRGDTLEAFADWWFGRTAAERLDRSRDAVHLMTIHAAKGLEFRVVVLADCRDGVFPSDRVKSTDEDKAEDLRVLYVGATRAMDRLYCTCPTRRRDPWTHQVEDCRPSPYLSRPGGPGALTMWEPGPWGGTLPEGWL